MDNSIVFKRPIITIFIFYALFLIFLNAIGIFSPQKQSFLYYFTNYYKPVMIEGKVISSPEKTKTGQRFILEAKQANDFKIKEKVIVDAPAGYKISYGDIINIEGRISKPKKSDFPMVFDYQQYLARQEIYTSFRVYSFKYIESKPDLVKKFALWLQKDVVKKIDAYFKKEYADILKPVIIGDKTTLDQQTKDNFTDAGLMHILVVSGLNVGFVGGMFLIIFKLCGLPLKKASLLTIPFVFLYALATGANPPVLRAAIMFSSMLVALALDREPLIYNSLALSALLILILQPQQLFTASFQMSYAATIGIVYFYNDIFKIFRRIKNKFLKSLCGVFSVTLAAQIPIIPVCMYYFGKVSMISFVANVVVVPLIGIITPMGFIFYFFTFIFSYISLFLSVIISIILHFIIIVVELSVKFDFSTVSVAKPSALQLVLFFCFLLFITRFKDRRRFILSGILLILSFLYLIIPKFTVKNKLILNIYDSHNITTLQTIDNGLNSFILYQNTNRYDKYYIDAFRQFLSFSGIKKAEITLIGFKESDVLEQIKNRELIFEQPEEKHKVFDMNFYGHDIKFDMISKNIYIDKSLKISMKGNPSFYFSHTGKTFKIKNPRK